jgi:hypothetical protein
MYKVPQAPSYSSSSIYHINTYSFSNLTLTILPFMSNMSSQQRQGPPPAELTQHVQSTEQMLKMFRSIQEGEHQLTFLQMCVRLARSEPGPIEINGELEWEVERILACRIYQRKLQYQVSWVGYTADECWYPARNFKNCPHLVRTFHEEHPDGPPPPRRLEEWARCFEAEEVDGDHVDDDRPAERRRM